MQRARCLRLVLCPIVLLLALQPGAQGLNPDVATLVQQQDVEGLRAMGPDVVPHLLAIYRSSNEDGRANVAWLLYQLGFKSEAARRVLMDDVHTEHESLRIWSQYALGRVSNDDSVVDVLFENMKRNDRWLFRDKAACGLAYDQIHLSEPQKVRLFSRLIDSLSDDDEGTRKLAIQVLAVYTGQRKGFDPLAPREQRLAKVETWWRWLQEYRANVEP